jgi:HAD superfamily hydrolase (TIGR01549 family)
VTAYDAVLFDNDGILIEPPTGDRQLEAARRAFREYGVEGFEDDHLEVFATSAKHHRVTELCERLDLDADELWQLRDEHDQQFQHEDIAAGVRTHYGDLEAIADCDVDRAVVSNNHHTTVEFILDHLDIDHLFSTYYGREPSLTGLRRKKPNPHYIERALEDLGAETALYVGDKETDVLAAENAGLDSVFVRRDHCRDVTLETTPDHEIETLAELPALVDGREN